jgi:hypothetical protein
MVTRASFTYEPAQSALHYDVRVTGVPASRIAAVALRRRDARGMMRVTQLLSGPNVTSATGSVVLSMANREALLNGQLVLTTIVAGALPADTRVNMPKPTGP